MDAELFELLACPQCQGPLESLPRPGEQAEVAGCACRACRLFFVVQDGIANFLLEDAQPLPERP